MGSSSGAVYSGQLVDWLFTEDINIEAYALVSSPVISTHLILSLPFSCRKLC